MMFRWGGRVKTIPFGKSLVELGANWIHGGSYSNPVFNLANQSPELLELDGIRVHRLSRRNGLFYSPHTGRAIDQVM